jgi:hypothetical protein
MNILASAFAVMLAAQSGSTTFSTLENALVVRQSARPQCASGIAAVWADFDVAVPDGRLLTMYVIYMGRDQFIPPVGSVCRIIVEPARIEGLSSAGGLDGRHLQNRVDSVACDTGAWSDAASTRN